jgi:hypothetical protein
MNCKTGDLAIVIDAGEDYQDCIGTIVLVGEACYSHGPDAWYITWPGQKPKSCTERQQDCPDRCLKPVSGLPLHDEVPEEISNKV